MAAIGWQRPGRDYFDLPMQDSVSGATSDDSVELEKGSVYSVALELPVDLGLAPKAGLTIESKVSKTVKMSWKVVSGHDYVRFQTAREDMRMFWAWS